MSIKKRITVALAGNPNTGKTTLFNRLTGSRQKVGNYSGVTVKKISGTVSTEDFEFELVDLPGTYSLTAYAEDELVARDFLLNNRPDLILNICDAASLERSLYLTVQLRELDIPMISVLNKWDLAEKKQFTVNISELQALFATPFLPLVADKGSGIDQLLEAAEKMMSVPVEMPYPPFRFAAEVENEINRIETIIKSLPDYNPPAPPRWLAIKLLEQDPDILLRFSRQHIDAEHPLLLSTAESRQHLEKVFGEECEILLVEERYGIIRGALTESRPAPQIAAKLDLSDRLDRIFLNRIFGLPVFALIMFLIFYIPFHLGEPLTGLVDNGFTLLGESLRNTLPAGFWRGLIVDGIIGGLGGVLVFVPQILLLFACISFLEATGYMSRAAFVVDRFMHKLGLHGKSFVPLIIGFGCSVPALLATRSLDNRSDRLTTMMAIPFMSCSARLPVYVLFLGAFFPPGAAGLVLFGLYLFGIVVAVITAKTMRKFVYRGEQSHFIMELPPYRMPTLGGVLHQMWEKAWLYLRKAGTLLLAASALLWILTNYPKPSAEHRLQREKQSSDLIKQYRKQTATLAGRIPGTWTLDRQLQLHHSGLQGYFTAVHNIRIDLSNQLAKVENPSVRTKLSEYYSKKLQKETAQYPEQVRMVADAWLKLHRDLQSKLTRLHSEFNIAAKKHSIAGQAGTLLAPLLSPAGLGDWRIGVALVSGFAAKEIIVSTLGTIYGLGENEQQQAGSLRSRLQQDMQFLKKHPFPSQVVTKDGSQWYLGGQKGKIVFERNGRFHRPDYLVILSLLVFVLLYVPCQAATIVFIKEGGWKNGVFMVVYTTAVAWLFSTLLYQIGRFLGV